MPKITEPHILRTVRFDKLGIESHPYTPLKPTESTSASTNSSAINLYKKRFFFYSVRF